MIPVSHLFSYLLFMTNLQKIGYISLGSVVSFLQNSSLLHAATSKFGEGKIIAGDTGTTKDINVSVQGLISNALLIIGLVAVVYGIYGGVLMMTAGGDEEKVKKGRTILIQVAIGIVVIFLANSIVRWFLSTVMGGDNVV